MVNIDSMNRALYFATIFTAVSLTITSVNGLSLEVVKPQVPQDEESNIKLSCFTGNQTKTSLHEMVRMRLMKLDTDRNGTWTTMAVLHYDQSIQTLDSNITASGYSGDVFKSFLTVLWPSTITHLFGRYRCDAIGYTEALDGMVTDESPIVDVADTSQQTYQLYKLIQDSERKMVTQVQKMMRGLVNSSVSNILKGLTTPKLNDTQTIATTQNNKTNSEIVKDENDFWPKGNFTLLMPDTGCPVDPSLWKEGLLEMKIENDRQYVPVNTPLRMAPPHTTREGFVYKQVCSLFESSDRKRAWPEGSYCIQTFTLPCPGGFKLSVSKFDGRSRDETNTTLHGKDKPEVAFHTSNFCCRHDGSPENPIVLPKSRPFYLHRHKGECQKVKDMQVAQDLLMMATLQDSGGELWLSGDPDYLPDVSMGPVKEELCYYF